MRFSDRNHLHDMNNQSSAKAKKPFTGKVKDVLRAGAIKSHDAFTIDSYNTQLIKHNGLYS